jgi:predicted amidohydrolase
MDYRVSVLQYEPKLLDKQKNLLMLREMLCELDTDLVVLPELCTTGYLFPSREALVKVSEEFPSGEAVETFSEIAFNRQMSIVYGFSELSGDTLYNSCALINPDGSHHLYRKTHLFDREKLFFTLGDTGFNVFTAKGGVKIGMMICFDWQFPEAARTLAMKGAQILCHPSNLVLPWCQQSMLLRSLENRVFFHHIQPDWFGNHCRRHSQLYRTKPDTGHQGRDTVQDDRKRDRCPYMYN